jgi:tetratricopeptide (TPR) repeat protein
MRLRAAWVTVLWASTAAAGPSFWDVVREPALARADQALRVASRSRAPREVPHGFDATLDALLDLRAAMLVELAGGRALPGTDLLFFLGDALIGARAGREAEGRALLLAALAARPDHPLAARAWFAVALASNLLRDGPGELLAYDRALEREWNPEMQARIHLNRGETRMLEGNLAGARRDYETSLALATSSEGYALAHWGLAVALSREGDLPSALEHAHRAASLSFPGPEERTLWAIDLPGVFFTPAHEVHTYRALGLMALAQRAPAAEAAPLYERALGEWDAYLAAAGRTDAPWLEAAEHQRQWCRSRLERAEGEAKRTERSGLKRPAGAR